MSSRYAFEIGLLAVEAVLCIFGAAKPLRRSSVTRINFFLGITLYEANIR